MQEVTSLSQILSLVAVGAAVLLALAGVALSGIFFFMSTRLNSRAERATAQVENSTRQLAGLYDQMNRDSLEKGQNDQREPLQPSFQSMPPTQTMGGRRHASPQVGQGPISAQPGQA